MNRKGFLGDTATIVVVLFMLAMVGVVMTLVLNAFLAAFENDSSIPEEALNIITTGATEYPGIIDFWFVLFLVGLPLGSAILAYFNDIHPLYFWCSLLLVVLDVMFGATLSELWSAFRVDETLAVGVAGMPMTDYILQNYAIYVLFVFVIIAMGTFVKLRQGGGYYS